MSFSLPIGVAHRSEKEQDRPASAWMILSPNPEHWLKEMLNWQLPKTPKLESVRIYPIPLSATDLTITAAFVKLPHELTPKERPLAIPYSHLGHRIYIPSDSDVFPALRDDELQQLNRFDLLVLHPSLGPIGFDIGDSRGIIDLFAPLAKRDVDWETAVSGLSTKTRIASISLILPPNIFVPQDESPAQDPKNAPPAKGTGSGWNDKGGGAEGGNWLSSKVSSWLNSFSATHPPRLNRRDQSIQKLIDELQSDPDEALKKAISLGSSHASRGIGPSHGELANRNVNFDLRELGGGTAADFWDLKPQQVAQLRQHYVRLASRERSLGRHRRAAYIYANLLGDLNNAALMLKEGHFFQEAARLYKDLLHDPNRAADCYVRAGLHQEAIAIYQELKAWQILADLHTQMEQPDLARTALYAWVNQLKNVGDVLQAADVLFDRLGVTDEALHLLESAWPHHRQAWLCITRALNWRASQGEIDLAIALIKRIGARVYPEQILPSFLSVLIEVKKMFASEKVCILAEDLGRIHVAKYLSQNNSTHEQQNIISSLISLGKEDHLLRRDALRFIDENRLKRAKEETQKLTRPLPQRPREAATIEAPIELITQFPLKSEHAGSNEIWFKACPFLNYFVALGYKDSPAPQPHQLRLTRSTFDGHVETFPIPVPTSNRILLTNHCGNLYDLLFIHPLPKPPENPILKQTDSFPRITEIVGNFIGDSSSLLASTFSTSGDLWTLHLTQSGLTLTAYHSNGTLLCNLALDAMFPIDTLQHLMTSTPFPQACVCVLDKFIALSFADQLFTWETTRVLLDDHFDHYDIDGPITAIIPGNKLARTHLALVCEEAVYMLWPEDPSVEVQTVCENLINPIACFTRDGILVVIDEQGGHLFECDLKGTRARSSFKWIGPVPVALIPGGDSRHFVTLSKSGMVQIHQYNSAFRKRI